MASIEDLIRNLGDSSSLTKEDLDVTKSAIADMAMKNRSRFNSQVMGSDLKKLFWVLTSIDSDLLPAYCEVLNSLLDCLSPSLLLECYGAHVEQAFELDACHDVQSVALHQISRCAKDPKTAEILLGRVNLLHRVLDRLAIDAVSCRAKSVVLDLTGHCSDSLKVLFQGETLKKFEELQKKSSVENLRILELYCNVAMQSEDNCKRMIPLLNSIVESIAREKSDVLVLLNYIELLSLLLEKKFTLQFVRESSVMNSLRALLLNRDDPLSSLYLPGLIGFFGNYGRNVPNSLICDHSDCFKYLLELTSDPELSCAASTAVSSVARSHEGKRCLQMNMKREFSAFLKTQGQVLAGHAKPEMKVTALQCLIAVLELEDCDQADVTDITEEWTHMLSSNPLQTIWECAKAPFEDIRLNALDVLKNIAIPPWGRAELLNLPGFQEWLLDRATEPGKAGKEKKHAIVAALLEDANSIQDQTRAQILRKFFNEGPFYTPGNFSVVSGDV